MSKACPACGEVITWEQKDQAGGSRLYSLSNVQFVANKVVAMCPGCRGGVDLPA